ncbi:hypothetical protein MMC13_004116 [Lambiella insularis]|nr:hypothetical protein [Lambiella insularis]
MSADNGPDGEPVRLNVLAEKVMHKAVKLDNIAYCPTMDLIALTTIDEQTHVYRLNGQRVFGISNKKPGCSVSQLRWKPNGQLLAIAYSDSTVSLISAQTGKPVHQVLHADQSDRKICCLGWGQNYTDSESTRVRLDNLRVDTTSDDTLNSGSQNPNTDRPLDLPNDLAFLDVEEVLPRLSTLPASGGDDEVFSSRASMDAIFHSSRKGFDESADVLLIGYDDGTIHLSLYDFFEIGTFNTIQISPHHVRSKLLSHSSHSLCFTHALLVTNSSISQDELYFVPFDLRLIPETGRYLALLALKSTRLQNVLRYIKEVQVQIYREFNASQDLPRKFIRNCEEALQEKDQCDFVTAAYHLVLTGNCFPSMKEWLVEELGDRGHKRWDKAVATGYENVGRLVHEHLIPALQRFSVLLSRLRGLAKFQEHITYLGLSVEQLDHMFDTLNCLQLLAHSVLLSVSSESRQFAFFSRWLKQEIETQGTTAPLAAPDDSSDQDHNLDYVQILEFIQGAMLQSRLIEFLANQAESDHRPVSIPVEQNVSIYEEYKKEIRVCNEGGLPEKRLPGMDTLIARLDNQCKSLFTGISGAQKRKIKFGDPIALRRGIISHSDMRMVIEGGVEDKDECTVYIATLLDNNFSEVMVHRVVLRVCNGSSSTKTIECASLRLPTGKVKDVKFADDETMILVYSEDASLSRLLYIPYRKGPRPLFKLESIPATSEGSYLGYSTTKSNLTELSNNTMVPYIRYTFPAGPSWAPAKLEVNGRKGRRAACIIAEDLIHYRILDIDPPQLEDCVDDPVEVSEKNEKSAGDTTMLMDDT